MNRYIEYLERVWTELCSLPKSEFNKRMKEISSPVYYQYIEARPIFSDEPIVYCYPTPRSYLMVIQALEKVNE
jgi:hypothetical protein